MEMTQLFASRSAGLQGWQAVPEIQDLERQDVISLHGGMPDMSLFDGGRFASIMAAIARDSTEQALQYGPSSGIATARECVAAVMAHEGVDVDPGEVVMTSGGQQAIDLVCRAFLDPGDVVVAEAPTYPGALLAFASYQAHVEHVAMDDDGLRIDELEATLDRLDRAGRAVKLIYTIPTFQNPAGVTLSLERRRRLAAVAAARGVPLFEDDPYSMLRFDGEPLPKLLALAGREHAIYLGTFSKLMGPGVRLGWVVAPPRVAEKLDAGLQAATLSAPTLSQYFLAEYFAQCDWLDLVRAQAALYRRRRDAMLAALAAHFPADASWTRPQGGVFIWATLGAEVDTSAVLARSARAGVTFVPGRVVHADGRGGSAMRLSFSFTSEERIAEGIRRIASALDDHER